MRHIDRAAADIGLTTNILMGNAGRAVADAMLDSLGDLRDRHVLVLVGPGNNGGDGLVAAVHLHDAGAVVTLYIWIRKVEGDANFATTQQAHISAIFADQDPNCDVLRQSVARADVIVDALLGTGKARAITGFLKSILETVGSFKRPEAKVVAVDLPTGMDADTGAVDEVTPRADLTVTLAFPKLGLFFFPGASYVGKLVVGDIGLPPEPEGVASTEVITPTLVRRDLPARPLDSHKGTFGRVLVVAGSVSYVGAPALACAAAGRVGAGLVSLACPRTIYPILATKLTEAICSPLPDVEPGALGTDSLEPLVSTMPNFDVVLLGPGLGQHPQTVSFVDQLLKWVSGQRQVTLSSRPWVVDADGLNVLANIPNWWQRLPRQSILTPHPAELSRLLRVGVGDIQKDRLGSARRAATTWGRIVVLKGAFTIVASPEGQIFINPSANPALATAGTGDVLAGAIAGLLGQGMPPLSAAIAGVCLHSLAGEIVRDEIGEAGALAGDLLPALPRALRRVRT
ncbi:MAG: NAD(P)H-hydrate dehydratase [Chloroflexi bacterium]|nr:NAD(P)H-hydrate dehydratase [Chloroflexota bacterium]